MFCLVVALAFGCDERFKLENPGFEVALPSTAWVRRDQPLGGVLAVVLAPVEDLMTRCSILRQPISFLPNGLESREEQIRAVAGERYQRTSLGTGTIAGRDATYWVYAISGGTTHEWAFRESNDWVIFQLSAPDATWADDEQRTALHRMRDSFVWTGGAPTPISGVDATPPERIRAVRRAALESGPRPFEVERHEIHATIEPQQHAIEVEDFVDLVARQDALASIELYTTLVEVAAVEADIPLEWSVQKGPNAEVLRIEFDPPLAAEQRVTLLVRTFSNDFFQSIDQHLVEEVSVLGQIRPRSTYSTHVVWYPIDLRNDAAVDITFDVPAPYVAITGGRLVESGESGARRSWRYVEEVRVPRLLPFGFAVGEYLSSSGTGEGGLTVTSYGFAGEEKRVQQRVATLLAAAAPFERTFGPLPWKDVRFVHVTPERKETGVSTPGMIVVSDFYYPDLEGVDASDGNLDRPSVLGLLVVADELSHQWNIYAAGLQNELGEGISTYTNALFVEELHGHDAYVRTIRACRDGWIVPAGGPTEFAVANPEVYSNSRYRSVVFCKTPLVLHLLRRELGDEPFFAGMRRGFTDPDRSIDGFERLQRGFEQASGRVLTPFFDQWFYRAGFPQLEFDHAATAAGIRVTVRQVQPEPEYFLPLQIEAACEDGSTQLLRVELREREQSYEMTLPSPMKRVTIDSDGTLPAQVRG